ADDLFARCRAAVLARPGAVISHETAARLLDLPGARPGPIHVTETRRHGKWLDHGIRPGIVCHRNAIERADIVTIGLPVAEATNFAGGVRGVDQLRAESGLPDAIPITMPVRTLIDLAAAGWSRNQLVVAGDALISDRFAYCRLTEIRRRVKALHG